MVTNETALPAPLTNAVGQGEEEAASGRQLHRMLEDGGRGSLGDVGAAGGADAEEAPHDAGGLERPGFARTAGVADGTEGRPGAVGMTEFNQRLAAGSFQLVVSDA